jgi:hypothetical protein
MVKSGMSRKSDAPSGAEKTLLSICRRCDIRPSKQIQAVALGDLLQTIKPLHSRGDHRRNRWLYLKRQFRRRSLSTSIGLYRYQAKYFDGQSDGKIEVALKETKHFQAITNAGND